MLLDHFVLTFKWGIRNPDHVCIKDGKTVLHEFWNNISNSRAVLVSIAEESLEIGLPIKTFLDLKENKDFQAKCIDLVRLRTTPKTLLGRLCFPVNCDNSLPENYSFYNK